MIGIITKKGSGNGSTKNLLREISVFKDGINGIVYPRLYKSNIALTVVNVLLMSNTAEIYFSLSGVNYTSQTIVGIQIPAGVELGITDIDIKGGYDSAEVILQLKQP